MSRTASHTPSPLSKPSLGKAAAYEEVIAHIKGLLAGEQDTIAVMSTIVCELHNAFDAFDWTGFYRVAAPGVLKVGPYQGGHGCLTIPFEKGVCGKCAREGKTQLVQDVRELPYHIACSISTLSEIVVPVLNAKGEVFAVLDVDSNILGAFDEVDVRYLEQVCGLLGKAFPPKEGWSIAEP